MINIAQTEQTSLILEYNTDTLEFKEADLDNIEQMLPQLYDTQKEDVLNAELRFQEGKGRLFTNGTGTGKTFVGLGIAYRFFIRGKKNILIVTPNDKKCSDWVKEGAKVDMNIYMLKDSKDAGYGPSTTTYANYYQNDAIEHREWDLIIYDESHYLMQNISGDATVYLHKHKVISNVPSAALEKAKEIIGPEPKCDPYAEDFYLYPYRLRAWETQVTHIARELVNSTKVVFLSATPFAYHKSIQYADGCLWDIEEKLHKDESHQNGKEFEKFLCENFGYRMRYGKCTLPESGVDVGLLEREFFERNNQKNIMSTRKLELPFDYSRHFVRVHSDLGDFINSGIEMWNDKYVREKYPKLTNIISKKYDYNFTNQMLEAIKAKEIITRVKQHLALGRKVVVFHNYNHTIMDHPFKFDPYKLTTKEDEYLIPALKREIVKWEQEYQRYVNLDLENLSNARDTFRKHFPDVLMVNGKVSKGRRKKYIEKFNDDNSGHNLILVQSHAGKEGISLHDKTGKIQRVSIDLSLPVEPNTAIQKEGRIYRSGLQSNAVYEYATLHTFFEKIAFADKVAERSKTVENLAMGHDARDLEHAFKDGYINYTMEPPNLDQGTGGKAKDKSTTNMTEFDKAKTYYWMRMKKTAGNKSEEGFDYFATPEPLGYTMVRWMKPQPNEDMLEPSVGHGAIGRFFPGYCNNTFIEPSHKLYAEMKLYCTGRSENTDFESFHITNKYDAIIMNPPFGRGGSLAFAHIEKALKHMSWRGEGSRLMAIVPCSSLLDKRLQELVESKAFANFRFTAEIMLPSCTFGRAGTNVATKIIRFDHVNRMMTNMSNELPFRRIDLRHCSEIGELFDELEQINF